MVKLNLPDFSYNLKKDEGKILIFDVIRKKFIVLTPEEWVRQHFINYMIDHLKYPKSLIKIESGLRYNTLQKRTDIVVYNRDGKPWMVVECKAFDQTLDQQTIRQISTYNHTLQANFITITNGMSHLSFEINWKENETRFLESMPVYPSH